LIESLYIRDVPLSGVPLEKENVSVGALTPAFSLMRPRYSQVLAPGS
jgi:hypothetical protein